MDRYRLIAGIIVCLVYLFAMFPIQTTVIGIALAIAYIVLRHMPGRIGEYSNKGNGREFRRREALNNARIYLAPYNDIWKNLKLSNTHCSLKLQSNEYTIVGRDLEFTNRTFRILRSKVHPEEDLWNMFCNVFDHNTTFDRLVELCRTFQVDINITGEEYTLAQGSNYSVSISNNKANSNVKIDISNEDTKNTKKEKLDINNASEVELTALPGISIVMAKKIIKKREDIGGFKNVNEFLNFIQLKQHLQDRLKDIICVNKMQGSGKIKRYSERSIDL